MNRRFLLTLAFACIFAIEGHANVWRDAWRDVHKNWVKPGGTQAQHEKDAGECRFEVTKALPNIWEVYTEPMNTASAKQIEANKKVIEHFINRLELFDLCMRPKGYVRPSEVE